MSAVIGLGFRSERTELYCGIGARVFARFLNRREKREGDSDLTMPSVIVCRPRPLPLPLSSCSMRVSSALASSAAPDPMLALSLGEGGGDSWLSLD